jgi:hypothetical protein
MPFLPDKIHIGIFDSRILYCTYVQVFKNKNGHSHARIVNIRDPISPKSTAAYRVIIEPGV